MKESIIDPFFYDISNNLDYSFIYFFPFIIVIWLIEILLLLEVENKLQETMENILMINWIIKRIKT
jgi:hypothetical protein